jgi:hypothetical protein
MLPHFENLAMFEVGIDFVRIEDCMPALMRVDERREKKC